MSRTHEPLSICGIRRESGCARPTIAKWLRGEDVTSATKLRIESAILRLGGVIISATPKEARMSGANS